jgi:hypothetical protein
VIGGSWERWAMRESPESGTAAYKEWLEVATSIMAAAVIFAVLVARGVLS